jgi:hypothetical protein
VADNSGSYSGLNEIDAREKISMKLSMLLTHEIDDLMRKTIYAEFMKPIIRYGFLIQKLFRFDRHRKKTYNILIKKA